LIRCRESKRQRSWQMVREALNRSIPPYIYIIFCSPIHPSSPVFPFRQAVEVPIFHLSCFLSYIIHGRPLVGSSTHSLVMHFPFSLAVALLLTPVLGSVYPRDAYERLYARNTYYAELETRQAYQNILARQAYAHPELQGHGLGPQRRRARDRPIRTRGTHSRVYTRKRLRTRGPPPASTLASLPESNREGADTPSHSDTSGNHPATTTRIPSPFANAAPAGRVDTSEIQPHPDQHGAGAGPSNAGPSGNALKRKLSDFSTNVPSVGSHPHPEAQSSGALRTSGSGSNGEQPRPPPSLKTNSNGGGRPGLSRVSFDGSADKIGMRKSASSPAFRRGGLYRVLSSGILQASEEVVGLVAKSASRKHSGGLHSSSSHGGSPRAGGSHAGGEGRGTPPHAGHEGQGSPTPSRASRSSLHSAGSSPGAGDTRSNHRGQMGNRPREHRAANAPGREHLPPSQPPPAAHFAGMPVHPSAGRARSRKAASNRGRTGVRVAAAGGATVKKGKHPHLERPPKRLTSTKPWNAIGLGLTATGAGVAGGASVWGALEAQKGASAAVLSAQAGLKIANSSVISADAGILSAQAGVKGANAAALSAQAGMKGADASQLSAEAGMKSANAAMLSAQQSIKSANGTQLIGSVQLATAIHDNITTVGKTFSDFQAGKVAKTAPAGRKQKRSYPPVVLYYDW